MPGREETTKTKGWQRPFFGALLGAQITLTSLRQRKDTIRVLAMGGNVSKKVLAIVGSYRRGVKDACPADLLSVDCA